MSVRLTRKNGQWFYRGLAIERKQWIAPLCYTSYALVAPDGKIIANEEKLRALKEEISLMEECRERPLLDALAKVNGGAQ